jgi:hypothetical protein
LIAGFRDKAIFDSLRHPVEAMMSPGLISLSTGSRNRHPGAEVLLLGDMAWRTFPRLIISSTDSAKETGMDEHEFSDGYKKFQARDVDLLPFLEFCQRS